MHEVRIKELVAWRRSPFGKRMLGFADPIPIWKADGDILPTSKKHLSPLSQFVINEQKGEANFGS